uniref:Uncharacterized protein n=1 Tax=viral metagenome TaxID=1070528 RepID=A0A6M3K260_9ZZZZ
MRGSKIIRTFNKILTIFDVPEEKDAFQYIHPYWNGKDSVEKFYDTGMIATKDNE